MLKMHFKRIDLKYKTYINIMQLIYKIIYSMLKYVYFTIQAFIKQHIIMERHTEPILFENKCGSAPQVN